MSLVPRTAAQQATPPSLLAAIALSTERWQHDLESLFKNAAERFPDVVWELQPEGDDTAPVEEVWGHKAMVYARAPPSFQARYFAFRPAPISSPTPFPYSASPPPFPQQSSVSLAPSIGLNLDGGGSLGIAYPSRSPSPSHYANGNGHFPRSHSPAPSNRTTATTLGPGLTRFPTAINPALFANELEYLYTGKGFGAAFEFLFDSLDSKPEDQADDMTAEESRVDKLRKDLVFMWRSRLYSDIRIALTGSFSSTNHETSTAVFSSHRFILVSRSPYFHTQLLKWGIPKQIASSLPTISDPKDKDKELPTLNLPSPPFTPASLHFTLGYVYTGTLVFSHRTYDLDTAFAILTSAVYLQLDALHDEVQARIVQEMLHGLFHAFLEFAEYERVTGGKWGVGGCRCKQCARRAPRTLEFAVREDVRNPHLERGARRALVGLFGDGWCHGEFAGLPQKTREGVLKGVAKRTTPLNVFPLLWAANGALRKLDRSVDRWADVVREMVLQARKTIDDVLCKEAAEVFEAEEWVEMVDADGVRFEDADKVGEVMEACKRGLGEANAGILYQALVSNVLLRVNDQGETVLTSTSHIRVQVETLRTDVLRWLRKRWLGVRQQGGFDTLEPWAVKEISGEIEIPVDELLNPGAPPAYKSGTTSTITTSTRGGLRPSDGESMRSIPRSIASRNVTSPYPRGNGALSPGGAASIRSVARSTASAATTRSRVSTSPAATRRVVEKARIPPGPRPDSKLTPGASTASIASTSARSTVGRKGGTPTTSAVRSSSASYTSVRSHASTIRTSRAAAAGPSSPGLRGPPRPQSEMSMTSEASTEFKTAKSELTSSAGGKTLVTPGARARRLSAASTASNAPSVRSPGLTAPKISVRRSSAASTASIASSIRSTKKPSASTASTDHAKMKSPSQASIRSNVSTPSSARGTIASRRTTAANRPPVPETPTKIGKARAAVSAGGTIRARPGKTAADAALKRKASTDTIKESSVLTQRATDALSPQGATLSIGIPCIISSQRARFRAFARYIGEVAGERGPWVGVEVPVSDNWTADRLEGRQWHDGVWGGIRYFDLGGGASEWGDGRRRVDWKAGMGRKREGAEMSVGERAKRFRSESPAVSEMENQESRGLFVRPDQVLYVVDAVGADI